MVFGSMTHLGLLMLMGLFVAGFLVAAINYFRAGDRRSAWLCLLGTLYPLGEMLQPVYWIPWWIRWHVSDIGFVFSVTALPFAWIPRLSRDARYYMASWGASVGIAIAVTNELMTLAITAENAQGVGGFDSVDLMLFGISWYVATELISGGIREEDVKGEASEAPPSRAVRRREERQVKKNSKRERH